MNSRQRYVQKLMAKHADAEREAAARVQLPQIYAAIALAIYELHGDKSEEARQDYVAMIIHKSQLIWHESVSTGVDVVQLCIDRSGLDVRTDEVM